GAVAAIILDQRAGPAGRVVHARRALGHVLVIVPAAGQPVAVLLRRVHDDGPHGPGIDRTKTAGAQDRVVVARIRPGDAVAVGALPVAGAQRVREPAARRPDVGHQKV